MLLNTYLIYFLIALLCAARHVCSFSCALYSRSLLSPRETSKGRAPFPSRHGHSLRRPTLRAVAVAEQPSGDSTQSSPSSRVDVVREVLRPLRPMDVHRRMAEQRALEEAAHPDYRSPDIPRKLRRLQDLILTRVDVDVRNDPGDRERLREFMDILAEEPPDPKVGDILTGAVSCTNDRGVYIDVPDLSVPAFMPWSEVSLLPLESPQDRFPEGAVVSAKIIAFDKFPVVSLRIAEFRAAWQRLVDLHAAGGLVDVAVTDVNRGGALCTCQGLRGFIPSSHFIGTPDPSHIGKQYKAKILQIDASRQQVQFSLRQALMADFVAANGTIVKSAYQPGSLLSGTVSGVMDFGVFLNLEGGGSGLLHRSSISAMPIPRLSDVFHVNQTIKVVIQSLDPASGRCGLETKSLERRPGDVADNITRAMEHAEETFNTNTANGTLGTVFGASRGRPSYARGDVVQGRVSGMAQYGAFLTLPGGASGLLHKADMSSESGVSGAFPEGIDLDRELTVVVDAVNATSGRLRLSLRPLERYPGEARRNLTAMMADAAADMATKWYSKNSRPSDSGLASGGASSRGGSAVGSRYRQSKERLLAGSLRTMTSNPFDSHAASATTASSTASGSGSSGSSMPWKDDFIAKILRQINLESSSSSSSKSFSSRSKPSDPSVPLGVEDGAAAVASNEAISEEGGGTGPTRLNMDSLLTSIQDSIESEILDDGDVGTDAIELNALSGEAEEESSDRSDGEESADGEKL